MAIKADFSVHKTVLTMVAEAQGVEKNQREEVEEQKLFLLEKGGMWDAEIVNKMPGRYRGQFDQISPINDQITGEMTASDFAITVAPTGGEATEETAEVIAGIIRHIENISNASELYSRIGKSLVMGGLDGLEVVQKHVDANTFDQDLMFEYISDWYKSVWFDLGAVKQDKSDAEWAIKLRQMPAAKYDKRWPDGSGMSVGDNLTNLHGNHSIEKYDSVTVGKLYYKKPRDINLVKMSDGAVYEDNSDFKKIKDEKAASGITVVDTRVRKSWRVYTRLLDGGGWLGEEEETVFSSIPLVPVYGNYEVVDTKNYYSGKTRSLMDAQRGLNFAISAETEDVALSPKDDIWMTPQQKKGHDYSQINVDGKACRLYNHDPQTSLPPFRMGARSGSPGLQNSAGTFQALLQKSGNMDDPSMGQNPGLQSGVALNTLVQQSNNGSVDWFKSMETCICQLYNVCVEATPETYDGARQQRILGEDGTSKTVSLNERVVDDQTQTVVELNDLTKGSYSATCSMGAAFKNQQEQATSNMIDLLQIDPAAIDLSRDVLYKNQTWPGSDVIAKRARQLAIDSGTVQESELTDEERQEIAQAQEAAAQQPQQEDPNLLIAQAEMGKAEAEQTNASTKQQEAQINAQIKLESLNVEKSKVELETQKVKLDMAKFQLEKDDKLDVDAAKIEQGDRALDQKEFELQLKERDQEFKNSLAAQQQQVSELTEAINQLKGIREASGADAIVGPGTVQNFKTQSDIVSDEQDES